MTRSRIPLHTYIAIDVAVTTTILRVALSNALLSAVVGKIATRLKLFLATVLESLGVSWVGC